MAGYSLVDAAVNKVMDAVALPFDEGNSHAQGDGTLADKAAWCANDLDGCFGPSALREDPGNEFGDLWRHNLECLIYVTNVPVAVAGPRLAEATSDIYKSQWLHVAGKYFIIDASRALQVCLVHICAAIARFDVETHAN